jgi:hypothetical protein
MGRVINTNAPAKRRSHLMRTIAEIIRRLGQHQGEINDEVRDMVAMIVLCLREIDDGIVESIQAWEKRGYWQKADKFQQEWLWTGNMAAKVEKMLRTDDWDSMPEVMMKLFPHFSSIEINKMTRDPGEWAGCYQKLLDSAK